MFRSKDREFLAALETEEALEKRISSAAMTRMTTSCFAVVWSALLLWQLIAWLRIRGTPVEKVVGIPPALILCVVSSLSLFGIAAVAHAELRSLYVFRKLRQEGDSH